MNMTVSTLGLSGKLPAKESSWVKVLQIHQASQTNRSSLQRLDKHMSSMELQKHMSSFELERTMSSIELKKHMSPFELQKPMSSIELQKHAHELI